jgi:hypothetical protein
MSSDGSQISPSNSHNPESEGATSETTPTGKKIIVPNRNLSKSVRQNNF